MRKTVFAVVFILTIFTAINSMAASGFGGYITGGGGISNKYYGGFPSISMMGGGLLYDTNVDKEGFSYRLNLGVDRYRERFKYISGSSSTDIPSSYLYNKKHQINIPRINLINDFGFGVYSSSTVRFYLGPQLGFGAGFRNRFKLCTLFSGPVLGLNYHISDSITLSFQTAFSVSLLVRNIKYSAFNIVFYAYTNPFYTASNPFLIEYNLWMLYLSSMSKYITSTGIGYSGNIYISIIYKFGS